MAVDGPVTIRIGRVIVHGGTRIEADQTTAALRAELTRLVTAQAGLPPGWNAGSHDGAAPAAPLRAVTPGGRGREAAGRIMRR